MHPPMNATPEPSSSRLQLPHTADCLVCGRENPHGLRLDLHVEPDTGLVISEFVPTRHHVGFEGIIHGGLLATVLDEAMVWAATWQGRRFCVCGEMTVRFRRSAEVGEALRVEAKVESSRRIVVAAATLRDAQGAVVAEATGKYFPVPPERHRQFVDTMIRIPQTEPAIAHLRGVAL